MAVETNATVQTDLIAQSVDFTEQFNAGIQTLLQILGKTRITTMPVGSEIRIYKSEVTKVDGAVGENEKIPLSKVTRKLDHTESLHFDKWRKIVSAETIQSSGFKEAVYDTDSKLLREIQNDKKKQLFDQLAKGTGKGSGAGLQMALSNALGKLTVPFEDIDTQTVLFINPTDVYKYLGIAPITLQNVFGLKYVQDFLGFNLVIQSNMIPAGTFYATVVDNINIYKAPVSGGALGQAFSLTTDETGLIGMTHRPIDETLSYQTVILSALAMFPERLDGIIVGTIEDATAEPETPAK